MYRGSYTDTHVLLKELGWKSSDKDSKKLFQVIGAEKEDEPLLKYWMTGLSDQYKKHILAASMGKEIVS